jgi:ATP-dependent protease HslVU (ClpYQ) ATPase subunit
VISKVRRRTPQLLSRRETLSFNAPDTTEKQVQITGDYVRERLAEAVKDEDLSKFIP